MNSFSYFILGNHYFLKHLMVTTVGDSSDVTDSVCFVWTVELHSFVPFDWVGTELRICVATCSYLQQLSHVYILCLHTVCNDKG